MLSSDLLIGGLKQKENAITDTEIRKLRRVQSAQEITDSPAVQLITSNKRTRKELTKAINHGSNSRQPLFMKRCKEKVERPPEKSKQSCFFEKKSLYTSTFRWTLALYNCLHFQSERSVVSQLQACGPTKIASHGTALWYVQKDNSHKLETTQSASLQQYTMSSGLLILYK